MAGMSCIVEFIDHWQTLLGALAAGALGFAAAIATVRWTLRGERRKADSELQSMKKALGAEVRQYAHQALNGHRVCRDLASRGGNFSVHQILSAARFPDPVIYPHAAARLGSLGDGAHWIVNFFGQIQVFKDMREHMRDLPIPASIPPNNAISPADALLWACEAAVHVLPLLRTGSYYLEQDQRFAEAVQTARENWNPAEKMRFTEPLS